MNTNYSKGEHTEELLREYFLDLGYFVLRSIKFRYQEFDITDIDLFLYTKTSPFHRERTIIDIKRKKTPQAIERIFWTKGLQMALKIEKAIVATTDNRQDVVEFGNKNAVYVLDGNFISRIDDRNKRKTKTRINEEEFLQLLEKESIGDLYGNWRIKYEEMKSLIIKEINFNTCNKLLNSIKEILEYYITSSSKESSIRLIYFSLALFLVSFDFCLKDIAYKEEEQRINILNQYFKYGQHGFQKTQEIIKYVEKIIVSAGQNKSINKEIVSDSIENEFRNIKSIVLAEYFGKNNIASRVFDIAVTFEKLSFQLELLEINKLSTDEMAIIGILCDFFSIDRTKIL